MEFEDDEIIQEFLVECAEHLDILDVELVNIEKNADDANVLATIFRSFHTLKGGAGMLSFHTFEKVAHAAENLLSLIRDGKLRLNSDMVSTLLETIDVIRVLLKNIETQKTDGDTDYTSLINKLNDLASEKPPTEQAAEPSQQTETETVESPAASHEMANTETEATQDSPTEVTVTQPETKPIETIPTENQSSLSETVAVAETKSNECADMPKKDEETVINKSLTDNTVRIQVDLLDKLMNLVGELVLSRNQILQLSETEHNSSLAAIAQRLNIVTSELQEGVMKTRMQPIGSIWSKFPRLVRDLANTFHKKVNIQMTGMETELDKTLIESIKDPLTHIIRNCIDHGIEAPQDRLAKNKPEEGNVYLSAYHESGHVNIVIKDDGKGIDINRVKEKAINAGILNPEQCINYTEKDFFNLIFTPGLSTAETVTNVSGRGVGMDVVKTNIEKINGTIDIESEYNFSTTLHIKIPLTLAIIPALIISCEQYRFAIPQINLLELVRLEKEQIKQDVHVVDETPIFRLRGKLLPLINLAQELELSDKPCKHENQDSMNIVVLQAGEAQFGLIVEQIRDTQEIVVKPLNKLLRDIDAFAGATIMGDGKVSLILDVNGLARKSGILATNKKTMIEANKSTAVQSDENLTLLMIRNNGNGQMAIPLDHIDRIEEFMLDQIEKTGTQEVVQYRNTIMPLVRLPESSASSDKIYVIVNKYDDNYYGLVVSQVYDIVEGQYSLQNNLTRPGVLGSMVVDGKVTELVDIQAVLASELPNYKQQGAAI